MMEPGSNRGRPRRRIAGGERVGRCFMHEIIGPPAEALYGVTKPSARARQIAFTRQRPPREAAAKTGQNAADDVSLAHSLEREHAAADSDEPSRERQLLTRAVPAPPVPNADRRAVRREIESAVRSSSGFSHGHDGCNFGGTRAFS
jgi:hypothetical protein